MTVDPVDAIDQREAAGPKSSPESRPARGAARGLACVLIGVLLLAALGHNLHRTWQRWGDIVYDAGRELDTPKQLAAGKLLYRDVRYWYGPLAPYVNASLYRVFGVRLAALTTAGILSALVLAWLLYRVTRLFAGRAAAAATAIGFLYICAFGQYLSNNLFMFPLPYSYPATYGILLAVASLYFLLRHMRGGGPACFVASCVFLALTALCKVETLFAAAVPHGVFLVAWLLAGRLRRLVYLAGYAGAVLLPLGVYAWFWSKTGGALFHDNLFLPGNIGGMTFTLEYSGLARPSEGLREAGLSLLGMIGCAVAARVAMLAEARVRTDPTYDASLRVAALGAICLAAAAVAGVIAWLLDPYKAFRSLPLLLLASFVVTGARVGRCREERARSATRLVLYAFGLAGLARLPLKAGAEHYGFYLLVPGLIGFTVIWCREILGRVTPASARALLPSGAMAGQATVLGLLGGLAYTHAATTNEVLEISARPNGPAVIQTEVGTMISHGMYTGAVDELVRYLAAEPPGTTVVAVPEGAAIAFMAGKVNPLGVHTFLPIDFSGGYDEEAMIRRLEAVRPDYVIVLPRPVQEFGKRGFGDDYARALAGWIGMDISKSVARWGGSHYHVAKSFRAPKFMAVLMKKNAVPATAPVGR